MSRLFITPREIDFINDMFKEVVKDVVGQKIYYYPISKIKSQVHDIYEESPDKVFENPIEIDALVKYNAQEIRTNKFGSEEYYTIDAYIQKRDIIHKNIDLEEGDFFSYGETFFEVVKAPTTSVIFGEIEYRGFITISGRQSRKGQFISKIFGPTSEEYMADSNSTQDTFVQQRGFSQNRKGDTGDIRDLQKKGILDKPITGPAEVSPKGTSTKAGSSFYDES